MRLVLFTDAWEPQVNGVVTTLRELVRELRLAGHDVEVIHPSMFRTRPCPGYAGIDLAVRPGRGLRERLRGLQADAVHIATEGPIGWAARAACRREGLAFTTAYHTRFPEVLQAAARVPLALGYALMRHFHRPSAGVMVPTEGVRALLEEKGLRNLRPWTHGVDTRLFPYHAQPLAHPALRDLPRPLSLYVGRISYEKNIEAFLTLPVPGSKVVCGEGPLRAGLEQRHPRVRWLGILPREELARVYAAADVFVFPSRHETFGLVMLEAMACGTPVAAYDENGPREVLATGRGGALGPDLRDCWQRAIAMPRPQARTRANAFAWSQATRLFLDNLVAARPPSARAEPAQAGFSQAR